MTGGGGEGEGRWRQRSAGDDGDGVLSANTSGAFMSFPMIFNVRPVFFLASVAVDLPTGA